MAIIQTVEIYLSVTTVNNSHFPMGYMHLDNHLFIIPPTGISNGNRTEWSPIRSVIIRVINKIGRPRSGSPICLITSMITD